MYKYGLLLFTTERKEQQPTVLSPFGQRRTPHIIRVSRVSRFPALRQRCIYIIEGNLTKASTGGFCFTLVPCRVQVPGACCDAAMRDSHLLSQVPSLPPLSVGGGPLAIRMFTEHSHLRSCPVGFKSLHYVALKNRTSKRMSDFLVRDEGLEPPRSPARS